MRMIAFELLSVAKDLLGFNLKEARQWIGIVRDGSSKVKSARPGQSHAQVFGNFETLLADNRFIFTKHNRTLNWYAPPDSSDKSAAEMALGELGLGSGFHHDVLKESLAI